ncbi:uncharacterized protein LOC117321473 [Pecten maximus]|uniref:uncharacterized protein LOC117321473 n=1 Tax=Pecten maximus TaxID=6579 RepID=UPI0014580B82|nr:uncharacterized protein LOC117321473 [Pecten maximus]
MAANFMSKGQVPSRVKGQAVCIHHKGRQLELFCEECSELACTQCLSSVHRSHSICELRDIMSQKKQEIKYFIDQGENVDLVQAGKYIASIQQDIDDNASTFEKLSKDLKIQTQQLIEDLELQTSQTLSLYRQMEEENSRLLQTYKQDLERFNTQLKQQIDECKTVLQRGSHVEIYDTARDIQGGDVSFPVKPTLSTAIFHPPSNPGDLQDVCVYRPTSGKDDANVKAYPDRGKSVGPRDYRGSKDTRHRFQPPEKNTAIGRGYDFLPQMTRTVGSWQAPCPISGLSLTTDDQIWTKYSHSLTLLDREGKTNQMIQQNDFVFINDISFSSQTDTLWVCNRYNVMELVSGRLSHRFSTAREPKCLCITANIKVIVGMTEQITKLTVRGEVIASISEESGKPVVRSPQRIAECPITQHIAIVDWDLKSDGGDGKKQGCCHGHRSEETFYFQW